MDKNDRPIWTAVSKVEALKGVATGKTLNIWCQTGVIPAKKIGNRWFVHRDQIELIESEQVK
jgi:hypothetical protein